MLLISLQMFFDLCFLVVILTEIFVVFVHYIIIFEIINCSIKCGYHMKYCCVGDMYVCYLFVCLLIHLFASFNLFLICENKNTNLKKSLIQT